LPSSRADADAVRRGGVGESPAAGGSPDAGELLDPGALPAMRTAVPGPASVALGERLARVESRNVTRITADAPIFWTDARGAAVRDADGNVYVDLSAGFGVAFAGHAADEVVRAIAAQAARLAHGLGDVHPPAVKVELLERLAALAPGRLGVAVLGSAGAEAVEIALKTALLRTGLAGVLAFEGGYHGLTAGALAVTHRAEFRDPFVAQLNPHVSFAPYPDESATDAAAALDAVDRAVASAEAEGTPVGAILVEPILGRGGLVVPPAGFLAGLRERCDGSRRILIFDEIYTGFGRTGRWFACEHEGVTPDVLCVGKALTGSIALSAAIGTPDVMEAWPHSRGEAIHTSTFLGNPVACAAALAQLRTIEERGLLDAAVRIGERIRAGVAAWGGAAVATVHGRGLLQAVRFAVGGATPLDVASAALARGVIVLAEGSAFEVLALTPPAVITAAQLDAALDVLGGIVAG
jgi:4-aminobutyrate aminotransferase-like enzyme